MRKLKVIQLVLSIAMLFCTTAIYAAEETFTITTYYPSPYGSYNELSANRMKVGDVIMPTVDGKIAVATSVIFAPQASFPTSPQDGELGYSNTDKAFYYYNGSTLAWVPLAGGGGGYCRWMFCDRFRIR